MAPQGSYRCGWCGTLVSVSPAAANSQMQGPQDGDGAVGYFLLKCTACERGTLMVETPRGQLYFPPQSRARIDASHAPATVQGDYEEALRAFSAGAYRAAAGMARRAVQSACLDLGADKDKRLVDQIAELHKEGEISNRLKALSDRVRSFGNQGLHPRSDGLDPVKEPEADRAIRFLEHLIEHVYTIAAELDGDTN